MLLALLTVMVILDGNTLDIVLSNLDNIYHTETKSTLPANLSSDHYMVLLHIRYYLSKPVKQHYLKYDFSNVQWDDMNQFFNQYDFTLALNSSNTEFIWSYLKTAINSAVNLYVPQVHVNKANQPKWFNSTIRHKIKSLRTIKRQLARHPTESRKLKVTSLQNEIQHMVAEAKLTYESKLVLDYASTNNSKIFKHISSIKKQDDFPSKMSYNDEFAVNDLDKAQLFNKYFYSVFTAPDNIPINEPPHLSSQSLHEIQFTQSDVFAILTSLDINKACGFDNFNPKIFRYCASSLLQIICHLFSTSILSSTIPIDWRTHCIVPVFKSGDKSSVCNYRPISLLCILSKVLERIVYNSMIDYIRALSTKHQFGFLPGRSVLQQLLIFTENLLGSKCEVDVVYMDFKKAFDSVSHNHLLNKLQEVGITGKLWKWLEAYLSNRFQCVRIGQSLSNLCNVLSGVPQGSVLGPLLFVIFINDLPSHIKFATPFIFADDTKCSYAIKSPEDIAKLQSDINYVTNWSHLSDLPFNEAKFVHLRFWSNATDNPTYVVNGKPIKQSQQHKDLGMTFSSDLNWTTHYKIIITKAYQTLGLIRRTFNTSNTEVKKKLYIALVRSQLIYCSQICRPQLIKDIVSLERVQRRATKYILNDYTSSYKSRLQQLHILPLMYVYELNDLMFLVKSLKFPNDNFDITDHITFASNSTRSASFRKLVHSKTSNTTQHHFYFNRISRLYNYLPVINLSLSTNIIKQQISDYLWTQFSINFDSERPCTFHILCPCYRCSSLPVSSNFNQL